MCLLRDSQVPVCHHDGTCFSECEPSNCFLSGRLVLLCRRTRSSDRTLFPQLRLETRVTAAALLMRADEQCQSTLSRVNWKTQLHDRAVCMHVLETLHSHSPLEQTNALQHKVHYHATRSRTTSRSSSLTVPTTVKKALGFRQLKYSAGERREIYQSSGRSK